MCTHDIGLGPLANCVDSTTLGCLSYWSYLLSHCVWGLLQAGAAALSLMRWAALPAKIISVHACVMLHLQRSCRLSPIISPSTTWQLTFVLHLHYRHHLHHVQWACLRMQNITCTTGQWACLGMHAKPRKAGGGGGVP